MKDAKARRNREIRLHLLLFTAAVIILIAVIIIIISGKGKKTVPETESAAETESGSEKESETIPEISVPPEYQIEDFPTLLQNPELPTGCEITSATMVLNYYGFDVDKVTMAYDYLPTTAANDFYQDSDGLIYGTDIYNYFLGDPGTNMGYVCGPGAIITAINSYLEDSGSKLKAIDINQSSFKDMYSYVSQNIPVITWITISMSERVIYGTWYTSDPEGNTIDIDWGESDHCGALIGYTENTVTIADPLEGITEYDRAEFESVVESRRHWSVIVK